MNLEKLSQDIKTAMVFVANLKNENETLQNKITSLELHNSTLESLLKEREQSHSDLLRQKGLNDNNVLDKIISLQMDHKLKEEHRNLVVQLSELQKKYEEAEKDHIEKVKEVEERGEERVREEKEKREKRESELLGTVQDLERKIGEMQREAAEQRTKVDLIVSVCCLSLKLPLWNAELWFQVIVK